jgi:hypothetical protein
VGVRAFHSWEQTCGLVHRYLHQSSAAPRSLRSHARNVVDAASGQHLSLFIHTDASAAEVGRTWHRVGH